jgi:hypothetical protein
MENGNKWWTGKGFEEWYPGRIQDIFRLSPGKTVENKETNQSG